MNDNVRRGKEGKGGKAVRAPANFPARFEFSQTAIPDRDPFKNDFPYSRILKGSMAMNYSGPLADVAPSIFQLSQMGSWLAWIFTEKVMGHIASLLPSLSTGQAALRRLGSWELVVRVS